MTYYFYIAGPMTGYADFNFPLFHEAEKRLREQWQADGHTEPLEVLNPATHFGGRQDLPRRIYLAKAVREVWRADALLLLPDWGNSEGARLEVTTALDMDCEFHWYAPEGTINPMTVEAVTMVLRARDNMQPDETIEQEAGRLVRNGPRQQTYGHPRGDFDRVARRWSVYLDTKLREGVSLTAEDIAIMMIDFKLARLSQTPQHRDTKVDIIGYTICLDRLSD